jgi:hypothetical protein
MQYLIIHVLEIVYLVWDKHQKMLLLNLESQEHNKINLHLNHNKKHIKHNNKDYLMMKLYQLKQQLKKVKKLKKLQ